MMIALFKTMRPKQWVKNGFLFAALIFDGQLGNLRAVSATLMGFAFFSLAASTIYILNDLSDLQEDRQHPKKKNRPLPSGALSPALARWAALIFAFIALAGAYWLNPGFFILLLIYMVTNLSYSRWVKHIPLLDVLFLAGFYVLRVGAGVTLIEVERFSPWLYVFTTFLALYIGIGKRRAELTLMADNANNTRRVLAGYTLPFLDQLIIIVSSMTIITYSLYTFSAPNLPENHTMMLTIPFLIYGIFRYLYLLQVENTGESPEEVLFSDHPLQISILLWGLVVLLVFYGVQGQ